MGNIRFFATLLLLLAIIGVLLSRISSRFYLNDPVLLPNPSLFTQNTYHIKPLRKLPAFEFVLYEPHVRIAPGESLYWFFHLREMMDAQTGRFSQIFFAGKRIEELERWGTNFTIEYSRPDYAALSQRCAGSHLKWIANSCIHPSWESTLSRYVAHVERFLDRAEGLTSNDDRLHSLSEAKAYLRQHESSLISYLSSSSLNDTDKSYLLELTRQVFSKLLMRVDPYSSEYSIHSLRYSNSVLSENKDKGIYSLQIETTHLPEEYTRNLHIQLQGTDLGEGKQEQISNHSMIRFSDVRLENYEDIFSVNFTVTPRNLLRDSQWRYEKKTGDRPHRYYLDIRDFNPNATYLLHIKHAVHVGLNVSIQEFSGETIGNPGIPVSVYINPQVKNNSHDIFTKFFGRYPQTTARVEIATNEEISLTSDALQVELWEFYEPVLHLTKTGPLPHKTPAITINAAEHNTHKVAVAHTNTLQDRALNEHLTAQWHFSELLYLDTDTYSFRISPRHFMWEYFLVFACFSVILYLVRKNTHMQILDRRIEQLSTVSSTFASMTRNKAVLLARTGVHKLQPLQVLLFKLRHLFLFTGFSLIIFSYIRPAQFNNLFFVVFIFVWILVCLLFTRALFVSFALAVVMLVFSVVCRITENDVFFRVSSIYAFMLWGAVTGLLIAQRIKDR